MNDSELKLFLAKMLPELAVNDLGSVFWKDSHCQVKDTEWLHVCWLVEQSLDEADASQAQYIHELQEICLRDASKRYRPDWHTLHASWQQRAEALIKVKGL